MFEEAPFAGQDLRGALTAAGRIAREEGLRALAIHVLAATVYRRTLIVERLLNEPIPEKYESGALDCGRLDPGDVEAILKLHPERSRDIFQRRFAAGDECFVARRNGDVVAMNWGSRGRRWIPYLQVYWRTAPDEAYIYDGYTSPANRGQGLSPALAVYIIEYYRALGLRRTVAVLVPENTANLRARTKVGWRPCGVRRRFRFGWRSKKAAPVAKAK